MKFLLIVICIEKPIYFTLRYISLVSPINCHRQAPSENFNKKRPKRQRERRKNILRVSNTEYVFHYLHDGTMLRSKNRTVKTANEQRREEKRGRKREMKRDRSK